jgi:cbb3-type cytochrome c oxidase subunit II
MRMTEKVFAIGSLLIVISAAFSVSILPAITFKIGPSDIARPRTLLEEQGRLVYMENGCSYCHSQYIRPQDWGHGAVRVAQAGDYYYDNPQLLGSERTGPDLSQEGGLRTDDWHMAHFMNPRFTRPASIMPQFNFLTPKQVKALTAYVQSLGGKMADSRVARQNEYRKHAQEAFAKSPDENFAYIHSLVPPQWRTMPNPYGVTSESIARGKFVYQQECVGCHGNFGDGKGVASQYLDPKPANFNSLRRIGASGGLLYYQIMNGITGTAMMSFKRELESEKIWDVSNYIAHEFIGHDDGNTAPRGVDEIQEPVDPTTPPPPDPDEYTVPPPTSPALTPDQQAAQKLQTTPRSRVAPR